MTDRNFNLGSNANPYAQISEVAAKVGVNPCEGSRTSVLMQGADGMAYDVWEVVIAVLDKLDKAAA